MSMNPTERNDMSSDRTEWTWAEFREALGWGKDGEQVLPDLFEICNAAVRNGLTREQVADTLVRVGRESGGVFQAQALIDALAAQMPEDTPQ